MTSVQADTVSACVEVNYQLELFARRTLLAYQENVGVKVFGNRIGASHNVSNPKHKVNSDAGVDALDIVHPFKRRVVVDKQRICPATANVG